MIELIKLYSNNNFFADINFRPGANLILGERDGIDSITGKKTNGVGKSLSIEFLKFALLADFNRSRVSKIPISKIPEELEISLDLKIHDIEYTIKRKYHIPTKPSLISHNNTREFLTTEDANIYLRDLVYPSLTTTDRPSFREIMGPIIRDERSEFADIIRCYPITGNSIIPRNFKPHLFLFNFNLSTYNRAKSISKEIDGYTKILSKIRKSLTTDKGLKMTEVKAEINNLNSEVEQMHSTIEELKTVDSFEAIQKDLIRIEDQLDVLRAKQKTNKHEILKIKSLPKKTKIDSEDIKLLYNSFKEGLGDQIQKSLIEVTEFKNKIESFQNHILHERFKHLEKDLKEVTKTINTLDSNHAEKLRIIDNKGVLKNLKTSISVYNNKQQEHLKLRSQYQEYELSQSSRNELYAEKTALVISLDKFKTEISEMIQSFNDTIVEIHKEIMGNSKASFEINTINKKSTKEVISFDMRIDSDGSHSVEREKVFIYDMALLTNKYTSKRHPKFVVHDNIFEVDQDTLMRSLNYINELNNSEYKFQYIFTLNKDKLNFTNNEDLLFTPDDHVVANFTKMNKFLNFNYQEE